MSISSDLERTRRKCRMKSASSYKPLWYVLSGIGVLFIVLLMVGMGGYNNLEMTLLYGNSAEGQNITNLSYIFADYFVGDGSGLTNLSVNSTTINETCPTGQVVQNITDGSLQCLEIPSATPAGSDTQIQFNDDGAFGASSTFTYDSTNNNITVGSEGSSPSYLTMHSENGAYGDLNTLIWRSDIGGFGAGTNIVLSGSRDYSAPVALGGNLYGDYTVEASGDASFAVGGKATQTSSIAIGSGSSSQFERGVAIGEKAVTNTYATAIGANSQVTDSYGVAIGAGFQSYWSAESNNDNAIAIGHSSKANGFSAISIGTFVESSGLYSVAIGRGFTKDQRFTNDMDASVLFGGRDGSGQQNTTTIKINRGLWIGENYGETITMSGDDIYVQGRAEIGDFLVVGDNTESGLSTGDFNGSTAYVDAIVYKSPAFECSVESGWCKLEEIETSEIAYIKFDEEFNAVQIHDKNRNTISLSQLPDAFQEKIIYKKEKKVDDDARKACLAQGQFYEYNSGSCTLNLQAQCEADGISFWTGTKCLENPYLACEASTDSVWNLTSSSCEFNPAKECTSREWRWNSQTNECVKPIIPEQTLEQLQRQCLSEKATMWNTDLQECQPLRLYLAENYKQPTGAHNAYAIGDVIRWNNKYYESVINANVWNPSTYARGWQIIN
jgi:hypothetical protein